MPQVFDRQTGQPVDVSPEDAQAGLVSGALALDASGAPVALRGSDGAIYRAAPDKVAGALAGGRYSLLPKDEEEAHQVRREEADKGIVGSLESGAESALNQASFGALDAYREDTETPDEQRRRQAANEYHSMARTLGGAVGVVAPTLASGGLFGAVEGIGQAAARGIVPAAEIAEASLASRLAGTAVNYATQGAVMASPQALVHAAFGDPQKAAETLLWGIGAGAVLGGAGQLVGAGAEALGDQAAEAIGNPATREALDRFANERALKAVGAERSALKGLSKERIDELGNFVHESGLLRPGMSRQEIGDAIELMHTQAGGEIGAAIQGLDATTGARAGWTPSLSLGEESLEAPAAKRAIELRKALGIDPDAGLLEPNERPGKPFQLESTEPKTLEEALEQEDEEPPPPPPREPYSAAETAQLRKNLARIQVHKNAIGEDYVRPQDIQGVRATDEEKEIARQLAGKNYSRLGEYPVRNIPLSQTASSQEKVFLEGIEQQITGYQPEDLPIAVKIGDKYIISGGNHRVNSDILAGRDTIAANVLDSAPSPSFAARIDASMSEGTTVGAPPVTLSRREAAIKGTAESLKPGPATAPIKLQSIVADRFIKPGDLSNALRRALDTPELRMPMNADQARALEQVIDSANMLPTTRLRNGQNVISFEDAQNFASALRRKWVNPITRAQNEGGARGIETVTALDQLKDAAYQVVRDHVHQAADAVAAASEQPALVGALVKSKAAYAKLSQLEKFAAILDRQDVGNRYVSLSSMLTMGNGPMSAAVQAAGAGVGAALGGPLGAIVGHQAARVPGMALDFLAKRWAEDRGLVYLSALAKRAAKEGPDVFAGVLASESGKRLTATMGAVRTVVRRLASEGIEATAPRSQSHMTELLGSTNGLTPDQSVSKLTNQLDTLVGNPQALAEATATLSGPLAATAPNVADAYQAKMAQAVQYLHAAAPRAPPPAPFAPNDWNPTAKEKLAFHDKAEIVANPMRALEHVARGTLSDAHLDALQTVYPHVLGMMRQEVLDFHASHPGVKLPPAERQSVSRFLGIPLDPIADAARVRTLQAAYAPSAPPSAPPSQKPPKGKIKDRPSAQSAFAATQGPAPAT